jgi:hypothetical protein
MQTLKLKALMPGAPDVDHPKPERRITGNPKRETWNVIDAPVASSSTVSCGVWRCEPGKWRIEFGPHEHELFTVLQGRCTVTGEDGSTQTAGPMEAIFIPPHFKGTFEVHETITKTYAIVSATD